MIVTELMLSSSLRESTARTPPKGFLKSPSKSFGHVGCLHQVKKLIKYEITLNELVGLQGLEIKHLETHNVRPSPEAKAGPVIKCFVIPPNAKKKFVCLTLACSQIICRGFKEHDLIMCMSKVQVVVSLGS